MMPFSVLRTWGLSLIGWAILGIGIYCIYHWSQEPRWEIVELRDGRETAVATRDDRWPYLAAGVAIIAWSFLGVPTMRLIGLGFQRDDDPKPERNGQQQWVEQPDGTRLNVEIYGNPAGPTLVFTHGWSLDSTEWFYAKRQLASDYRLVVWDLPGLGRSQGPTNSDYSLEKMAGDLQAVVNAVAPTEPVVLVGHSIGGMITQTFCRMFHAEMQHRVSGLVLIHTTYQNPVTTALGAPVLRLLQPLIVVLNHATIALAPLAWLSNWQSYSNGSLHMASRISSFAGGQTWGQIEYASRLSAAAWPAVIARGNLAMLKFDERATLPSIEVPTLVIGAEHDRLTKLTASQFIEQQIPHGLLACVNAGHLGLWERHQEVCDAIDEFAKKYGKSQTAANTESHQQMPQL